MRSCCGKKIGPIRHLFLGTYGDVMSHFSKRIALLAKPSFRWYLISCFLCTFAGGMSYIALSWMILTVNNSLAALAILLLCFWLPNVFLGPLMGVVADRYSRRWLIIIGNGLRGLILMSFVWYFHYQLSEALLYLLMILLGAAFSIYLPAMIALIREIVLPKDLLYANSSIDIAFEVGNVTGMGSAGILMAWLSDATAIFITGIIFIISTLAMMRVKVVKRATPSVDTYSFVGDFILGLKYLTRHSKLMVIYLVQLLILVTFMTAPALLAPFAKSILHASVVQFGQINAALSIGVVLGGLFLPWVADRYGLFISLFLLCVSLAVFFGWFAINQHIMTAKLLYFFIGIGLAVWPLIVTKAQHLTDLNFQARVQSVFSSLSGLLILGVYSLLNVSSHFISIRVFYLFEVAIALTAAFLLWRYRVLLLEPTEVNLG